MDGAVDEVGTVHWAIGPLLPGLVVVSVSDAPAPQLAVIVSVPGVARLGLTTPLRMLPALSEPEEYVMGPQPMIDVGEPPVYE